MTLTGGCHCGAVRYAAEGPVRFRGQCLCRTCQKISGGAGNLFIVADAQGFRFTRGMAKEFTRPDPPTAPTRGFCGVCGVHLTARSPRAEGVVLIKVGTLDEPSLFGAPQVVVWIDEKEAFHLLPPGVPAYGAFPNQASA